MTPAPAELQARPSQTRTRRFCPGTSDPGGVASDADATGLPTAPPSSSGANSALRVISAARCTGGQAPPASACQRPSDVVSQVRKLGSIGSISGTIRIAEYGPPRRLSKASRNDGEPCSAKQLTAVATAGRS